MKTVIAALFEQRAALRKACNRGPYADRLFKEYLRAEQAIADVPSDDLDDLILKLEVAREEGSACTIYEDALESVFRDLVRMAAANRAALKEPPLRVRMDPAGSSGIYGYAAQPTPVQTLWAHWLALNDEAALLEAQQQFGSAAQAAALAKGRELTAAEPACLADCLLQLRRAELVEDWPAVSRAIADIARFAGVEPVPNPWDKPALAA